MITVSAKFNAIITAVFTGIAAAQYGIDVSFPVQHKFTQGEYLQKSRSVFGDDRINVYNDYVVGCIKEYTPKGQGHFCHANEEERLKYNVNQPPTMTNYTDIGFLKTRLSEKTFANILDFWEDEKKRADEIPGSLRDEDWPPGNTYTNHWYVVGNSFLDSLNGTVF